MKGVLFDVDGTLVDSNYLHALCWHDALRGADHLVPTAVVHRAIGMGSAEFLEHILGADRDADADEDITHAHKVLYRQHWERLTRLPGARELLFACHNRGLTVVLATSAHDDELQALKHTLDADDAIDIATSGDDAENAKPAPDIVEVALTRANLDAGDAVFVGDSVWDGHAAERAAVTFVGLTCGGTSEAELREVGAVEVYRDPADLLDNLTRLFAAPDAAL